MDSSIKKLDEMENAPLRLNVTASRLYYINRSDHFGKHGRNRRLELLAMEPALQLSGWHFAYAFPIPTHRPTY